ncbi:MAG: hypothetical protein E4G98_05930 [Promethearchaeota archaeon]|nr:MAG: hypothetical protein E4G98_05930 [Candidatus Lokiarchaeota archaeon]
MPSDSQEVPMSSEIEEVCIIGGGFAGMNTARLLAKWGIPSTIYTTGYGASNLWMGTVDVLNYPGDNLLLELAKFQVSLPAHPYANLSMELMQTALREFYESFPSLHLFQDEGEISNSHVLTSLGNTKLTTGVWNTIFRQFDTLTEDSICVLVEFREFANSAMHLIAQGLTEKFPGNYIVLEISLLDLFQQMNSELVSKVQNGYVSAKTVATFFDTKAIHMSPLASLIKSRLVSEFPQISVDKVQYFLFPPILGIDNSPTIFTHLASHLGVECYEMVSLTPSILADRFLHQVQRKLDVLAIPVHTNHTLVELERQDNFWRLHFRTSQGKMMTITSKIVIMAVGSIFAQGIFTESFDLGNKFNTLGLEFPDSIDKQYEIVSTDKNSNIYVVGAANFLFSTDLNEDDEAKDGTGLGLAIATSYKVAETLKARLRP